MADDRRIDIDIVANDLASQVFNQVSANASSIFDKLSNGISRTNYALRMYNSSMANVNNVLSGLLRVSGRAVYDFTSDSIMEFANLERQHAQTMGAMQSNYDKTAESQRKFLDDSKKLQEQAIRLGKVGPSGQGSLYDSTQISSVQTELVKSGISANDILNTNVLNDVIKFAGGNDISLSDATDFAVNLGTQFGIKPADWGEMLDKVTKAADISPIEVTDIMESMKYAGGISSGLGRSLDEVLGMISVMGMAGLAGNMAGTGVQAMFSRILAQQGMTDTQIKNAPTKYVGNLYNAFREDVIKNGNLVDMVQVTDDLNEAFEVLNDEEQAWFAKKMFGLYQMKAAYSLARKGSDGENLLEEAIDQISNHSDDVLDYKYVAMMESSYGTITGLKNAFTAVKQDFGGDLSPITKEVSRQLRQWLNDPNNYQIDWSALESAIQESGGLIAEGYGDELASIIENIGSFGIDASQILGAIGPARVSSLVEGLTQLFNGDFAGAIETFSQGIADSNEAIDGLPEDLQDTARACNNVITMFEALAALNIATQITQGIASVVVLFETLLIKPLADKILKIFTMKEIKDATTGTAATAVMSIANVNAMNVAHANVVYVYGAVVNGFGGFGGGFGSAAGSWLGGALGGGATSALGGAFGGYLYGKIAGGPPIAAGGYGMSPPFPELPGNTIGTPALGSGSASSAVGGSAAIGALAGAAGGAVIGKEIYDNITKLLGINQITDGEIQNMYVNGSQSDFNDYGTFSWKYAYEKFKYGYVLSDEASGKISPYQATVAQMVKQAYDDGTLDIRTYDNKMAPRNEATSASMLSAYIQGIADNWRKEQLDSGNMVTDEQYSKYVSDIITAIHDISSTRKGKNALEYDLTSMANYGRSDGTSTQDIIDRVQGNVEAKIFKESQSKILGTIPNVQDQLKAALENSNLNLKTEMHTEKSITLKPNFNVNVSIDKNGNVDSIKTSPSTWSRAFSDAFTTQSSRFGN